MAEVFKCKKCDKKFGSERALKIHIGMAHGGKKKVRRKAKKKAGRPKAAKARRKGRKGKFVCKVCGRSFKMAMHLARHMTAAHGKTKRRKVIKKARRRRAVGRPRAAKAAAPAGVKVSALSIDQLLAIKGAVDARLKGLARKMRLAKIRI